MQKPQSQRRCLSSERSEWSDEIVVQLSAVLLDAGKFAQAPRQITGIYRGLGPRRAAIPDAGGSQQIDSESVHRAEGCGALDHVFALMGACGIPPFTVCAPDRLSVLLPEYQPRGLMPLR